MAPPPPLPAAAQQKKKKKKSLTPLLDGAEHEREPAGDGGERRYTPIADDYASSFDDVASGKSDLWLIQLPDDVKVSELDGAKLKLRTRGPLAQTAGIIGSVTDTSGNAYALSEENGGVADQMQILVPAGEAGVIRFKPAKRLTLAVNSTGIDGRPLFSASKPPSQQHMASAAGQGVMQALPSPAGDSSKKKKKKSREEEGQEASPDNERPSSASKHKHKKHRHPEGAETPGTSGRHQDPAAEGTSGGKHKQATPHKGLGDASAEGKKKKKDKGGEPSAEKQQAKEKGRARDVADGQEGSAKKKAKKHKAAEH